MISKGASTSLRATCGGKAGVTDNVSYQDRDKPAQVRQSNITAAKAVCDAVRTSLGPRGMDKMIQAVSGDVTITNDGATILQQMQVLHPAAKMLVELSKAQDIEAGDGTTSVVIIAGSLLDAASKLLLRGIHPTIVSEAFQAAAGECVSILSLPSQKGGMSVPIDLSDRATLLKIATTSLSSKVVAQHSDILAPIAVDAVLKIVGDDGANGSSGKHQNVDLRDIRIVKKLGGTVEDTELIDGLIFVEPVAGGGGSHVAPTRVEKAVIGLIQFCISPPKPNMDHQVVVSDYTAMDRVLREECAYLLNIVKVIKKAGCNVLLIQKSILRDAVSDLALHFLAKMKIMVIRDIERDSVGFICKSLGCRPVASLDHFVPEAMGSAELVEQVAVAGGSGKLVRVTGVANPGRTVSLLVRGSNKLVLDEAERSIHDALCVVRCLVKKRALVPGGGAAEIELSLRLAERARQIGGLHSYCYRAFADSLEIIPYTLAENAGLNPIETVTELRSSHLALNKRTYGINVRRGCVTDMIEENVLQPLLVTTSAISLAAECVRSILKIDDVVSTVR